MGIHLIGAGVGRTGTLSLKIALEQLLGGTCHHMFEVVAHPDELPVWNAAILGEDADLRAALDLAERFTPENSRLRPGFGATENQKPDANVKSRTLWHRLEHDTDELAIAPYASHGGQAISNLLSLLEPAAKKIVESDDLIFPNPMGLPLPK